jgi:hypothetical protein
MECGGYRGEEKMSDSIDEKEQEKEGVIEEALEKMSLTKDNVETIKNIYNEMHEETGRRYYEYERLGKALDGGYKNLDALSGKDPIVASTRVESIASNCSSLQMGIQKEIVELKRIKQTMRYAATTESLSAAAVQILYGSTEVYESNANTKKLPPIPPSVYERIDPYSEDQPKVVEDLRKYLKDLSPELETLYLGAKEIFEAPHRSKLKAASSNMRTIIWEVYRKLAPHEKVVAAPGYKQIKKEKGLATYRQRVAYILTGTADLDGSDVELVNSIFNDLDQALGVFSEETKQAEGILLSDHQVKKTIAQCERALLSLLKNRKV